MWNGKRTNYTESGLYESRRSSVRKLFGNGPAEGEIYEFSNREVGWEDNSSKSLTPSTAWSLSQSFSCPDIFQKLAAGKRSPVEYGEVDIRQAPATSLQPARTGDGVLLRHRFCPWDGTEFRHTDTHCLQCGSKRTRSPFNGKQETLATLLLPPWERVLWKPQPYEDNYVPRSFLESLVQPSSPSFVSLLARDVAPPRAPTFVHALCSRRRQHGESTANVQSASAYTHSELPAPSVPAMEVNNTGAPLRSAVPLRSPVTCWLKF
jgi:hypothetical protein